MIMKLKKKITTNVSFKMMLTRIMFISNIIIYGYIIYELLLGPAVEYGLEVWKSSFLANVLFTILISFCVYPLETYLVVIYVAAFLVSQ